MERTERVKGVDSNVLTLAWLMRSPTKVDTSIEPDIVGLLRLRSCLRKGNAAAGGSSGTVTVYDCRMLGIAAIYAANSIILRC